MLRLIQTIFAWCALSGVAWATTQTVMPSGSFLLTAGNGTLTQVCMSNPYPLGLLPFVDTVEFYNNKANNHSPIFKYTYTFPVGQGQVCHALSIPYQGLLLIKPGIGTVTVTF